MISMYYFVAIIFQNQVFAGGYLTNNYLWCPEPLKYIFASYFPPWIPLPLRPCWLHSYILPVFDSSFPDGQASPRNLPPDVSPTIGAGSLPLHHRKPTAFFDATSQLPRATGY